MFRGMALWKKMLVGAGAFVLLAIVFISAALAFFIAGLSDLCATEVLAEYPSPNGKLKAVAYNYDCGATTGFATHVSILAAGESLKEAKAFFVADSNHGRTPSWKDMGPEVRFRWISDSRAELQYPELARVPVAKICGGGVQVDYVTFR